MGSEMCIRDSSAGSQLSSGSGIFVIISEIADHRLLRATVGVRTLLSSPKTFTSFFPLEYMVKQIYLIHRDGPRRRKGKKATCPWHLLYVKLCFKHIPHLGLTVTFQEKCPCQRKTHSFVSLLYSHATRQHCFTSDTRCGAFYASSNSAIPAG